MFSFSFISQDDRKEEMTALFCRATKSRIHGQLVSVSFRKVVACENFRLLCGNVKAGERIVKAYVKLCQGQ